MKTLIATWMYCEPKGEESNYPQVGGNTASSDTQNIYWRCIATFFASGLRTNSGSQFVLFTNASRLPVVDGLDLSMFFKEHSIEVVNVPFTHKVPTDFWGSWRSQFYLLDIIKTLRSRSEDIFYVFDSDCVFIRSVQPFAELILESGALIYRRDYPAEHKINGWSRRELQRIFEDMGGVPNQDMTPYAGGEIFAVKQQDLNRISDELEDAFRVTLERHHANLPKLNTESQLFSYVFSKFGYTFGNANPFIDRLWTTFRHREVPVHVEQLSVWHLPAEKKFGFRRLFEQVKNADGAIWRVPLGGPYIDLLGRFFGIPHNSTQKNMLDLRDYVKEKILERF